MRLRRERLAALRSLDLPAARSARTPAIARHLRVIVTASGVDLDSSELLTAPNATLQNAVRTNVVAVTNGEFRAQDLRGGESGFLIEPLRDALATHTASLAANREARERLPIAVYAPRSTSTKTMYKLLYTLGQEGFVTVQFAMRRRDEIVGLTLPIPTSSRERDREVRASDCDSIQIKYTEQRLTIEREIVAAGQLAHYEPRAFRRALAAFPLPGERVEVTDAAPPTPPITTSVPATDGALDREAVATAVRSITGDAGRPWCEEPTIAISQRVPHGAATELREQLEFELGLAAPRMGILN